MLSQPFSGRGKSRRSFGFQVSGFNFCVSSFKAKEDRVVKRYKNFLFPLVKNIDFFGVLPLRLFDHYHL